MKKFKFFFILILLFLNNSTLGMSRARRIVSRQIRPIAAILLNTKHAKKTFDSYRSFATEYRQKYNIPKRTISYENCIDKNVQESSIIPLINKFKYRYVVRQIEKTAYHEAGHALVALLLPNEKIKLTKISIIPEGETLGRITWKSIDQNFTKIDLLYLLRLALGGQVAEEFKFKECSVNGIRFDLKDMNKYTHQIMCKFGLNENLESYSKDIVLKIKEEMKQIIKDNYDVVYKLLEENKDKLEKLAHALLIHEILTPEQALKIIND